MTRPFSTTQLIDTLSNVEKELAGNTATLNDLRTDVKTLQTNGCVVGVRNTENILTCQKEIERLRNKAGGRISEPENGNRLSVGKRIKAWGWPAIILAVFIGFTVYNRYSAKETAKVLQETTEQRAALAEKRAEMIARNIVDTLKKELRP